MVVAPLHKCAPPVLVTVAVAGTPAVTTTLFVVAVQPAASATTAEYVPGVETLMDCAVTPLDHVVEAKLPAAVNCTVEPGHRAVGPLT